MARKAVGKTSVTAPGLPLADPAISGLKRWRRIIAEGDAADVAAAARVTLAAAAARQAPEEPRLIDPKAWFAETLDTHPRRRNEQMTAWARRLHELMLNDPRVAKPWSEKTMPVRLHEVLKSKRTTRTKSAPR